MKTIYRAIVTMEDGWYLGKVEDVQGAHTEAESIRELLANLRDVIILMTERPDGADDFEVLMISAEDGKPIMIHEHPSGAVAGGSTFFRADYVPPPPTQRRPL